MQPGRWLIQAKERLPFGEFGLLCEELPFSTPTAQRLMMIARDTKLSNAAHVQHLPNSWGTLYELTKLDDTSFHQALESGDIRPDTERAHQRPDPIDAFYTLNRLYNLIRNC